MTAVKDVKGTKGRSLAPAGWMTRDEVAAMVGIHQQNVLLWERDGKLPKGKKHGNIKVWKRTVMERYLETLTVEEDAA